MNHKPFLPKLLFLFVLFLGAGYAFTAAMQANAAVTTSQLNMTQLPGDHDLDCLPTAYGLEDLIDCVTSYMPAKGSNGYVTPTLTVQNDWQTVVNDMVSMTDINECSTISLPDSLHGIYAVFPFTDAYTGQEFCIAAEVEDYNDNNVVDRGWGTFIVNPQPDRFLNIDIPHPMEDSKTNQEGIQVFKGVGAHTFLMSGSNREANNTASPCQNGEFLTDVAHCIDNLFFPAVVEMDTFYTANNIDHTAIQFHGMGTDTGCSTVNIYITHGSASAPLSTDTIVTLRDNVRALQPTWAVAVPGEPDLPCGKNGTQNVEGRYLNGLSEANVCNAQVNPAGYSGKFIHIEQHPDSSLTGYRSPAVWIEALKNTFPPLTAPVTTTAISFQDGVSPDAGYAGTADTWIDGDDQTDNYGTAAICEVDGGVEIDEQKGALLRWDISSLPAGSTIHAAEVTLNVTDATNSTGHYAYALDQEWVELEANWLNYSTGISHTWEISGVQGTSDRSTTPIGRPIAKSTGVYTFTINPIYVQSWFDTSASNNGILITNLDNTNGLKFNCSETGTATDRPKLTIHYSQSGGSGTPTATPAVTATPSATPTATPTPTITPTPAAEVLYLGFSTSPTLGGVGYSDEDIIAYDTASASWSLYIDGSDVGLGSSDANDVDAFYIMSNGDLLFSFNEATTITGVGAVDSYDIVRFVPTSTGNTTAGTFSIYFDGSDVGLNIADENIVGIAINAAGNLLITTENSGNVGFAFDDDDLLEFEATQLGADTSGTWSLFFEGSDVALGGEDIRDFWVDGSNNIYFTLLNEFLPTGDQYDVFLCTPGSLGSATTCTSGISQYWDGSAHGITTWRPDSFFIAR